MRIWKNKWKDLACPGKGLMAKPSCMIASLSSQRVMCQIATLLMVLSVKKLPVDHHLSMKARGAVRALLAGQNASERGKGHVVP